ncbi:hypothetical protein VUR80DRAFT_4715 [Thermomyces stellatus]
MKPAVTVNKKKSQRISHPKGPEWLKVPHKVRKTEPRLHVITTDPSLFDPVPLGCLSASGGPILDPRPDKIRERSLSHRFPPKSAYPIFLGRRAGCFRLRSGKVFFPQPRAPLPGIPPGSARQKASRSDKIKRHAHLSRAAERPFRDCSFQRT